MREKECDVRNRCGVVEGDEQKEWKSEKVESVDGFRFAQGKPPIPRESKKRK